MGTSIEINGGEEGLWRIATALSLSFSCATVPLPPPTSGRHSIAVAVERTSRAESEVEGVEHGHDGGQRRGDWCGSGGAAGAGAARGSAPGRAEVRKPGKVGGFSETVPWMGPQVWVPLVAFPASAQVVPEPLGVVLIFSCWNFPLAGEHRRSQRGRADEEKLVRRSLEVRRDCAWTCTQPGGQRCKPRLHRDCRCLGAPCGNTRSPTLSRSSSLLPWSATRGRLARCKVGVRACGAGQTSATALAFSPGR